MTQITLSLLMALFITSCSSTPAIEYCENPAATYLPGRILEQEYDRYNNKCQDSHNVTVNKEEYKKNFEKSRKQYYEKLQVACSCESAFINEAKATAKRPIDRLASSAKDCEPVNMKADYLRGIDLSKQKQTEVDGKRGFWDKLWHGSTILTSEDAKIACGTLK